MIRTDRIGDYCIYFFSIYIHIIERGSRSTRGPRVYILYTTIIHVTLVNVVLVKNEWSAAQTRVDSKTSVTVYTILEHLQVSRPRLAPILAFSI